MAYDKSNMMMIATKPSPNQLFAGYGILKVLIMFIVNICMFFLHP